MKQPEALVFDCDGVLVNSEELIQELELELLADHGLHYEREEFCRRFLGVANATFVEELNADSEKLLGVALPDNFIARLSDRAAQIFATDLVAFDGVHDVVMVWPGRLAVASSSSAAHLSRKLELTGLNRIFSPHVYSTDLVSAGKPDPAIYLYTADKLGVSPEACIAIEDSINGVVSARTAGMRVIGFTEGAHCLQGHDELLLDAGAELVVQSMQELKHWLVA